MESSEKLFTPSTIWRTSTEIRARDQRAAQRGEQHREGHRHTHQHQRDKAADQHDCGEGCRRHLCSASLLFHFLERSHVGVVDFLFRNRADRRG